MKDVIQQQSHSTHAHQHALILFAGRDDGAELGYILAMSALSGVKRSVKAAREALAAKEYKDALQHCKAALKEDRSCYEAYV